ncbi:hypothetical protein KDM87_14520 [Undibacterium sp. FT147W]|uniref:Uncharacterized protein n=1 Tax=Undibacterium rivi TaxID=2828729 RepID=A0ABS5H6P5_9BURK|nr:hypothetical protein [Undibacterium rivi]MBR7793809.1 hypothetical protein [Undibacterium rivi]
MKLSKLNAIVHNHIVLNELVSSVKRVTTAIQIWRIDRKYHALNHELDFYEEALKEAQANAQRNRVGLMIRRQQLRSSMVKLGGN